MDMDHYQYGRTAITNLIDSKIEVITEMEAEVYNLKRARMLLDEEFHNSQFKEKPKSKVVKNKGAKRK